MAPPIDVRAGLTAALRRLVRDPAEWPMRDRRRFRNLLLDAVTSDAMPLAELLLRAADDGLLRAFPDRTAPRVAWDAATARLAGDLHSQRFVEPGVARFVADAWARALGPDPAPAAQAAAPRAATAPRLTARPAPAAAPPPARYSPPVTPPSAASTAAAIRAYNRSNLIMLGMIGAAAIAIVAMFSSTSRRGTAAPAVAAPVARPATEPARFDVQNQAGATVASAPGRFDVQPQAAVPAVATAPDDGAPMPAAVSAPATAPPGSARGTAATPAPPPRDTAPPAAASLPAARGPVVIAPAVRRTTDDIVLKSGRVVEGRVISVRQQTIVMHDDATQLDFELAKGDVERVVTREGRVLRFGADDAALLSDEGDLSPQSFAGTLRVRYVERWGTERALCAQVAREFAPGTQLVVRHLRGAPMLKLEFAGGQGFNASVRTDGVFESVTDVASRRGPQDSFVQLRLSGRIGRGGALDGVARITALTRDGAALCDLALTMRGERAAP